MLNFEMKLGEKLSSVPVGFQSSNTKLFSLGTKSLDTVFRSHSLHCRLFYKSLQYFTRAMTIFYKLNKQNMLVLLFISLCSVCSMCLLLWTCFYSLFYIFLLSSIPRCLRCCCTSKHTRPCTHTHAHVH